MTSLLSRFRQIVQEGDEEAFEKAMEFLEDEPVPPASLVERHEQEERREQKLERLDPTEWPPETWRCPQCGAETIASECPYCRRKKRVIDRGSQ